MNPMGGGMPTAPVIARPMGGPQLRPPPGEVPGMPRNPWGIRAFKKGGKVKKTGLAYLHKGEKVMSVSQLARAK